MSACIRTSLGLKVDGDHTCGMQGGLLQRYQTCDSCKNLFDSGVIQDLSFEMIGTPFDILMTIC